MSFVPGQQEWIDSHFREVPQQTADFCGSLKGLRVLNVGCGEMITDFGLLTLGVESITGLDVRDLPWDVVGRAAEKLAANGLSLDVNYKTRLRYVSYDGERFPFKDGEFDFVFSWSAFEHVSNVPAVLSEVRRVLKPNGRSFIQVFPWFHCLHGSHLSDYIPEPFFHLRRSREWVLGKLREYSDKHPQSAEFVLKHMWPEYCALNGYSARRFFDDVRSSGFSVLRAKLITYDQDVSSAPPEVPLIDLVTSGSMVLLAPNV